MITRVHLAHAAMLETEPGVRLVIELGGFIASRLLTANQQSALLAWHEKRQAQARCAHTG